MQNSFDVLVIGAGPGGYPAAIRAAQSGAKTALVERDKPGGTCLHCGCIPTKTLIASASRLDAIRQARLHGITAENISCDYARMADRKDDVVQSLERGIRQLLKANKIELIEGTAAFRDAHAVRVETGAAPARVIEARKIILATGSKPVRPAFLPEAPAVLDSESFLRLRTLPGSLLVLGGGYIGCELACLAALLGVNVTLVELLADILPQLDRDVRAEIRRGMKNNLGIELLTGQALEDIALSPAGGITARRGGEPLSADALLVAVGRAPDTGALQLENAGLRTNQRGYIDTNEYGQTAIPDLYAVGDVSGGIQLAHAATAQGRCAAEHACGASPAPIACPVPHVIFTRPEAAFVGIGAHSPDPAAPPPRVAKFHMRALGKALASGSTTGFVKCLAHPESGRILGAQAVGEQAAELIAEITLAIRAGLTVHQLASTIHAHPTLAEAWQEAAHLLEGFPLHAAPRK